MIYGIGIDMIEIDRIKEALNRNSRFAQRVLSDPEYEIYKCQSAHRQAEFVAGRFAAKEAFSKALGTGIGKTVTFHNVIILNDDRGKPEIASAPYDGPAHLSITHTREHAAAQVILER